VATLTKEKPVKIQNGLGIPAVDMEGRVISPNIRNLRFATSISQTVAGCGKLKYKMDFYEAFLNT